MTRIDTEFGAVSFSSSQNEYAFSFSHTQFLGVPGVGILRNC
jgi:hypothetical protein